jgi:hypothetical protein
MVDALYSEDISPRTSFEFFEHLSGCKPCKEEYFELVETRELLSEWTFDEGAEMNESPQLGIVDLGFKKRIEWWPLIQKIAAGVLILFGIVAIFQSSGLLPRSTAGMSEQQLTQIIHDLVVARQVEDWKVIGAALLNLKEELEAQNRLGMRTVYKDLNDLQQRYVEALEENNRQVSTLISQ